MKYLTVRISKTNLNKINDLVISLNSNLKDDVAETYTQDGLYRIITNKKATIGSILSFIIKTTNFKDIELNDNETVSSRVILDDEAYKILIQNKGKNQKLYLDSIINSYFNNTL